jgi:hypothetical protein
MPKRMMIWALALILLFGAFPLLTLVSAVLFASTFGCQLDEGSIHPCIVLGLDFGGLVYPMTVGGWFVHLHNTARRIGADREAGRDENLDV